MASATVQQHIRTCHSRTSRDYQPSCQGSKESTLHSCTSFLQPRLCPGIHIARGRCHAILFEGHTQVDVASPCAAPTPIPLGAGHAVGGIPELGLCGSYWLPWAQTFCDKKRLRRGSMKTSSSRLRGLLTSRCAQNDRKCYANGSGLILAFFPKPKAHLGPWVFPKPRPTLVLGFFFKPQGPPGPWGFVKTPSPAWSLGSGVFKPWFPNSSA